MFLSKHRANLPGNSWTNHLPGCPWSNGNPCEFPTNLKVKTQRKQVRMMFLRVLIFYLRVSWLLVSLHNPIPLILAQKWCHICVNALKQFLLGCVIVGGMDDLFPHLFGFRKLSLSSFVLTSWNHQLVLKIQAFSMQGPWQPEDCGDLTKGNYVRCLSWDCLIVFGSTNTNQN